MSDTTNSNDWGWDEDIETEAVGTSGIQPGILNVKLVELSHGPGKYHDQLTIKVRVEDKFDNLNWFRTGHTNDDKNNPEWDMNYKKTARAVLFHIVGGYIGSEELKKELKGKSFPSFEEQVNFIISKLPANFTEIPVKAILHYGKKVNDKGFKSLELPKSMKVTGPFWSVEGKRELTLGENLDLTQVTPSNNNTSSSTEEDEIEDGDF